MQKKTCRKIIKLCAIRAQNMCSKTIKMYEIRENLFKIQEKVDKILRKILAKIVAKMVQNPRKKNGCKWWQKCAQKRAKISPF